jgi:hypothetical protein
MPVHATPKVAPKAKQPVRQRPRAQDRWEREADVAAKSVIAGRLVPGLTARPVARHAVAGSPGAPLSRTLRTSLERSFSADLSAVRLHTDANAAEAVRAEGAQAFAAGRDVYVDGDARLELIAHEVAHVLQQTGSRGQAGRIVARDVTGGAEIQCKDDQVKILDDLRWYQDKPELQDLVDSYKGIAAAAEVAKVVAIYQPGFTSAAPAKNAALLAETKATGFEKLDAGTKAFYVDTLKAVGMYDAAFELLGTFGMTTATDFRSKDFYLWVRDHDLSWLPELAKKQTFTKTFYPEQLGDVLRVYVFGPVQEILDPLPMFAAKFDAEQDRLIHAKGINELELMTVFAARSLADDLKSSLGTFTHEARTLFAEKLVVAKRYATAAVSDAQIAAPGDLELTALYTDLFPAFQKIAQQAIDFWTDIEGLTGSVYHWRNFGTMPQGEVEALAKEVGTLADYAKIDPLFAKIAEVLVNAEPMPKSDDYSKKLEAQREALRVLAMPYSDKLFAFARQGKLGDRKVRQLGVVIHFLLDEREILARSYSAADDRRAVTDDFRLASRIQIANDFATSAKMFGLTSTAAAVAKFRLVDKPRLALTGEWKPVATSGFFDRSGPEMGDLKGSGLTDTRVSRFFYVDYLNAIASGIENALDPTKHPEAVTTSILSDAVTAAKGLDVIQRYEVHGSSYWYDPGAMTRYPGYDPVPMPFSSVVFAHPKTAALIRTMDKNTSLQLVPTKPPGRDAAIVLWNIPRYDRVVKRLMTVKALDDQVQAYFASQPVRFVDLENPWIDWIDALAHISKKKLAKNATADVSKPLTEALDADYEAAKSRLFTAARKATILQVTPILKQFADDDWRSHFGAKQAFDLISEFSLSMRIDDEQPIQMTLLALELADEIAAAFTPDKLMYRADVVTTVEAWLQGALDVWNDAALGPRIKARKLTTETDASLEAAAKTFPAMIVALAKSRLAVQTFRGLKGRKAPGNGRMSIEGLVGDLDAGMDFTMYGRQYVLVQVYQDFDYWPAILGRDTLGMSWPHPNAARLGAAILIDPTTGAQLPSGTKLAALQRRTLPQKAKKKGDPATPGTPFEVITLTSDKLADVDRFFDDFGDFTGLQYILVALAASEWMFERMLDVIEFIPGVGQGVMAARFAAAVLTFIESPEFDEILQMFKEEGFAAFPKLIDKVIGILHPDPAMIFSWFLFGTQSIGAELVAKAPKAKTEKAEEASKNTGSGVWAKLARVIRNVIDFGKKLLRTILALHGRISAPFRAIQDYVVEHPALATIISFVIRHFDFLSQVVLDLFFDNDEDRKDTDFVGQLKAAAIDGVKGVVGKINDAVNVIRTFELPYEIVPQDLIGEFVVDTIVNNLGAKYKVGMKAVRPVMDTLGLWRPIMDKIGRTLTGATGLDPNILYREYLVTSLQPEVDSLRKTVFSWLQNVFGDIQFVKDLGITINFGLDSPAAIGFAGIDFHEEGAPSPARSEHAAGPIGPMPAPSGGEPLAPPLRARAEAGFGHDFSHVRLHDGADAAAVTGAAHAEGLTSGSHVYLHPTVSPSGGGVGEHVLHHELAHVLQQTGARPLGGAYTDRPSPGRSGKGIVFDPVREQHAEHAASSIQLGTGASSPLDVGAPSEGVQPFFDRSFVKLILTNVHDPTRIRSEAIKVGVTDFPMAENALLHDELNKNLAENLPDRLVAAINAMQPADFQEPFAQIAGTLKKLTTSSENQDQLKKMIVILIARTREEKSGKRTKNEPVADPGQWLAPKRFAEELERYLFALTGLAFDLAFVTKPGPASIGNEPVIDLNATKATSANTQPSVSPTMRIAPFASLKAGYLHLPFLGDTPAAHELWELLVMNTFSKDADYATAGTPSEWISASRLALGHLVPKAGMYLKNEFKLSSSARRSVRSQLKAIQSVLATAWPSPDAFAKPTSTGSGVDAHTGLRVGTFGDLNKELIDESVLDRDPHHIPQVLLIDYFSNSHKLSPFPELGNGKFIKDLYPGVTASSATGVTAIGNIDIDTYTKGTRSDALPSIQISKHTHMAEIHVGSEPIDERSKQKTMGAWVRDNFIKSVGASNWSVMAGKNARALLEELRSTGKTKEDVDGGEVTSTGLARAIVTATRVVYSEMRSEMSAKLRRGLEEQEIPYFNLIAEAKKGSPLAEGEKLKKSQLIGALTTFDGKIDSIMRAARFQL